MPVNQSVGLRLAHDLTRIVPGSFKGRLFKKGHIVQEQDIPALLDIGKAHIYVMELGDDELHEDDAALRMRCGSYRRGNGAGEPHEGKVAIKATRQGLVKIDPAYVNSVNALGEIALATIRGDRLVEAGGQLAATRVIPLVVAKERIEAVEQLAAEFRRATGRARSR